MTVPPRARAEQADTARMNCPADTEVLPFRQVDRPATPGGSAVIAARGVALDAELRAPEQMASGADPPLRDARIAHPSHRRHGPGPRANRCPPCDCCREGPRPSVGRAGPAEGNRHGSTRCALRDHREGPGAVAQLLHRVVRVGTTPRRRSRRRCRTQGTTGSSTSCRLLTARGSAVASGVAVATRRGRCSTSACRTWSRQCPTPSAWVEPG